MQCKSPRARAGFNMLPASIEPSDLPAPTMVCSSSMNKMILPSSLAKSFKTAFSLSSNSPRYFAPAIKAPKSKDKTRLFLSPSGTSPLTIRCAKPSTIAVLPTPGSPINTGLFLVLRCKTCMVLLISSSRPITGSNLPFSALSVKSMQYFFKAPRVFSAFSSLTLLPPRISLIASFNFLVVKLQRAKISFNSLSPSAQARTNNSEEI